MIDACDYLVDIKLTFTLPCGQGAPPTMVGEFVRDLQADCEKRDGCGASFSGPVGLEAWDPENGKGYAGPCVTATLSVGEADEARNLIDDLTELAAKWWGDHPQHPLPTQFTVPAGSEPT